MSITISSATNTELEILYAALTDLQARPKPNAVMDLWRATLSSLIAQTLAQHVTSGITSRRWGGNEQ